MWDYPTPFMHEIHEGCGMDSNKPIQLIQECPLCGKKYLPVNIRTVSESDSGTLLYFSCSNCLGGLVATVVDAPFGLIGSGLVTDLQFEEIKKFIRGDKVTEDDVLAVHTILGKKGSKDIIK